MVGRSIPAMTTQLAPYLNFAGTAREVLGFYASVLGGTPQITTYAEFGHEDEGDHVMHGALETESGLSLFVADDLRPDSPRQDGPVDPGWVTLALMGDDDAALRRWWAGLAEGGEITVPLETAPWGASFGELHDRYGVKWMVNISAPAPAEPTA